MRAFAWGAIAVLFVTLSGCTCAQLPTNARFKCDSNGGCGGQAGFVCFPDNFCRVPIGSDAGQTDAGFDAGQTDAGFDAGQPDAGEVDAGFDAGQMDSGIDAGFDAGEMDAGADAGCVPTGAIDEPDQNQLDVDCDGFDGDLTRAVFVDQAGGLDSNPGTQAMPKQTFAGALTTGKEQIYLATGTFASSDVNEAVAVFGGYTPSGAWPRTMTRTVLNGSITAAPSDAGRVVFERLEVNGDAGVMAGEAAVALRLISVAASSSLIDLHLMASAGANGATGAAAPGVASGNAGTDGVAGDTGSQAGIGGAPANCGDAGFSGVGFDGGFGAIALPGIGDDGDNMMFGGTGGGEVVCDGGTCTANNGGPGLDGPDGMMSAGRPADPPSTFLGTVIANQWRGAQLQSWSPAAHGRPGGGGGGGGGIIDLALALAARGGGAGGGGSGGCGGRSGLAGGSGGASIALLLINSSPTLRTVTLTTTQGGSGGTGGSGTLGATGGAGGAPGNGETAALGTAGNGGAGGRGGRGGPGRTGPGGWGGPLIGVFCSGTSAPNIDGTTTWTSMGTPGTPGMGDPNGLVGGIPAGISSGCP